MDERDTLLTLAELAVAFAGFTGIVEALRRYDDESRRRLGQLRLRSMLEVALRNAGFAILPIPFLDLPNAETYLWRVGSGLYFVAVTAYVIHRRRTDFSSWAQSGALLRVVPMPIAWLLPISLSACLANVFGLGGSYASSLYLFSLILGLVSAGVLFLVVAAPSLQEGDAP